jgi:hypothetical protein
VTEKQLDCVTATINYISHEEINYIFTVLTKRISTTFNTIYFITIDQYFVTMMQ